jgi:hypothetical protein
VDEKWIPALKNETFMGPGGLDSILCSYLIPEIDFSCFADFSGTVFKNRSRVCFFCKISL